MFLKTVSAIYCTTTATARRGWTRICRAEILILLRASRRRRQQSDAPKMIGDGPANAARFSRNGAHTDRVARRYYILDAADPRGRPEGEDADGESDMPAVAGPRRPAPPPPRRVPTRSIAVRVPGDYPSGKLWPPCPSRGRHWYAAKLIFRGVSSRRVSRRRRAGDYVASPWLARLDPNAVAAALDRLANEASLASSGL